MGMQSSSIIEALLIISLLALTSDLSHKKMCKSEPLAIGSTYPTTQNGRDGVLKGDMQLREDKRISFPSVIQNIP